MKTVKRDVETKRQRNKVADAPRLSPRLSVSLSLRLFSPAFTLVELLVVVTIIVILIALLLPSLERAVAETQKARCLSNHKGIGTAIAAYVNEKKQYPASPGYSLLFGSRGINNTVGAYGDWDSDKRPLNEYMGYTGQGASVKIAQCPSDQGDPCNDGRAIPNCYEYYGNSYHEPLEAWGMSRLFDGRPSANVKSPHNKIAMGDYGMYGDRPLRDRRTRWHQFDYVTSLPPGDQMRQVNLLFADGHAEFFSFDNAEMDQEVDGNNVFRQANPSAKYW